MPEAVYMRGKSLLSDWCVVGDGYMSDARMSSRMLSCASAAVVTRKVAVGLTADSGGGVDAGAGEPMSDEAVDQAGLSYEGFSSSIGWFLESVWGGGG